jgi:hypothetical protein
MEIEQSKWREMFVKRHLPWLDVRLTQEAVEYLWDSINNSQYKDAGLALAGNISKSKFIKDKDNWFYENALKQPLEYLYFRDSWINYFESVVTASKPIPDFYLKDFWVNFQKQNEFNPPHTHAELYSFVVFMKIPTHWKEQHALPISANSGAPSASNFQFLLGDREGRSEGSGHVTHFPFFLSPEDEGRMLFFPAWLSHQVFPFYECEEERITVSGNIMQHQKEYTLDQKEQQLEEMERKVDAMKNMMKNDEEGEGRRK